MDSMTIGIARGTMGPDPLSISKKLYIRTDLSYMGGHRLPSDGEVPLALLSVASYRGVFIFEQR